MNSGEKSLLNIIITIGHKNNFRSSRDFVPILKGKIETFNLLNTLCCPYKNHIPIADKSPIACSGSLFERSSAFFNSASILSDVLRMRIHVHVLGK